MSSAIMSRKKTTFVIDKFLPEEQKGKANYPEWVTQLTDYMSDAAYDLSKRLADVTNIAEREKLMADALDCSTIRNIVGKEVEPIAMVDVSPKEGTICLSVKLKRGKNMPQEITIDVKTLFDNKKFC